jgi:hypothetical protein
VISQYGIVPSGDGPDRGDPQRDRGDERVLGLQLVSRDVVARFRVDGVLFELVPTTERRVLSGGLRFGAIVGLVFGLCFVLGAYSAFRMPPSALVVWPASFLLDSTIAAGVMSWVLVAGRPWRRVALVIVAAALLFVMGVVVQNMFLPTPADHLFHSGGI